VLEGKAAFSQEPRIAVWSRGQKGEPFYCDIAGKKKRRPRGGGSSREEGKVDLLDKGNTYALYGRLYGKTQVAGGRERGSL